MGSLFNQEKREVSEERRNKTYNEHISGISKAAVLCNSSMYGDGCRISAEPCTVRKCATVSRNRCSLCGDPGYTGFSVLPGGAVSGLCSADVFVIKTLLHREDWWVYPVSSLAALAAGYSVFLLEKPAENISETSDVREEKGKDKREKKSHRKREADEQKERHARRRQERS